VTCPECGESVAEGQTICPSCFASLRADDAAEPEGPVGPPFAGGAADEDDAYSKRLAAAKLRNALLRVGGHKQPGATPRPPVSRPSTPRRAATPTAPSAAPLFTCAAGLLVALFLGGVIFAFVTTAKRSAGPSQVEVATAPVQVSPRPVTAERPPSAEAPHGTLIFESDRSGDYEIYAVDLPGGEPVNLTSSSHGDYDPAWSPDGSRIAFVSDRDGATDVYVMNADGSDQRNVTQHSSTDGGPSWSPDGSMLLFHSDRDGDTDLYVIGADGTDITQLTDSQGWDGCGSYSPDGSKIVFESDCRMD